MANVTFSITAYMKRMGFGDYSKSDPATREEMENLALEYAAQEQKRTTAMLKEIGMKHKIERYEADEADAHDLMILHDAGIITNDERGAYYEAHGWQIPKYGFRD